MTRKRVTRSTSEALSSSEQLNLLQDATDCCSFSEPESDNMPISDSSDNNSCTSLQENTTALEVADMHEKPSEPKHQQASSPVKNITNPPPSINTQVQPRLPPAIIIEGIPATTRIPEIANELRKLFPHVILKELRRLPRGGVIIKCADPHSYGTILKPWPNNAFNGANISTRIPGNRLPGKEVVIRSVPFDITLDEVKEELETQGIEVNKLIRIKSPKTGLPTPLIKISIPNEKTAEKVLSSGIILYYNHHQVEEVRNTAPRVLQCFKCQRFGHTANACRSLVRCVRCSGPHPVTACPNEREATRCANCKGPHASSYRGCPTFQDILNMQRPTPVTSHIPTNTKKINPFCHTRGSHTNGHSTT
ncbi:uncharacterized protein LOC143242014 [Tachypleus tridentatus]|uniref:uncharacterized protein LOC143242014 n=1 Tax=Tachypleus tridentatus TaxID=6853 RepID=UPI003FD139E1